VAEFVASEFCPFATAATTVKIAAAAVSALLVLEALDADGAPVAELSVAATVAAALSVVVAGALAFWLGVSAGFVAIAAVFVAIAVVSGGLPRLAALTPAPVGTFALAFVVLEFVTPGFVAPAFVAPEFVALVVPAVVAPPAEGELKSPVDPAPFADADVSDWGGLSWGASVFAAVVLVVGAAAAACCGGGLAGGVAAAGAAGADAPASSSAANGISLSWSVSWLSVGGCARGDELNETAAARSDAIPGILGTEELPKAT
jgi:hypothetical protein